MKILPATFSAVTVGAPRLLSRLHAINEFLNEIDPPRSVLEIGPGLGDLSAHVLQRYPGVRLLLSEISSDAAESLRNRFSSDERVTVSQADLLFGDPPSDRFDLAIACEVFEHIEADAAGLSAVASLLNSGGYFIMSAPCHMRKWQAVDVFAGHYRRYEREELVDKLSGAGFDIVHLWTFGFPSVNLIQPLRELYYRSRNRTQSSDKQSATEKSGIDRPRLMQHAKWFVIAALLPLLPIERRYWETERGDGYLALARKR